MPGRSRKKLRCAIYTRKSTDEGLDQEFNSLDAQREACAAYITSQKHEGWTCLADPYDDGGISGATLQRPAMQRLLVDIKAHKVDVVVVYKVDRLTRALADFAKIVEIFDAHGVSFVSVTQQFNTTTSMGRLTLNVLLSFAQFEREVTAERIRDKIAASKKKGMWMGGAVPLGYDVKDKKLVTNATEAETVRALFGLYLEKGSVRQVTEEATQRGLRTKPRESLSSKMKGGLPFHRGHIYRILCNPLYIGRIPHKKTSYPGLHAAIVDQQIWDAVQQMMARNRVRRRRGENAKHPSILAGKLFDDSSNPFTPSHAIKKGRRYRYYVERDATQRPTPKSGKSYRRIPAAEIEGLVINAVRKLLCTPDNLLDALDASNQDTATTKAIMTSASALADRLKRNQEPRAHSLIHSLIKRVTLKPNSLQLAIACDHLLESLAIEHPARSPDGPDYTFEVAARLRPRGNELKFVVMDPSVRMDPKVDQTFIRAIVRANAWLNELMSGESASIKEIAVREKLNERYVRRTLDLAFLAPDITEAILEGRQPEDLMLQKLMGGNSLPHDWATQRRLLRFA